MFARELTTEFDLVIIGSGIAGLYASLCLPKEVKILIISKSSLLSGSTRWAQGGVASSLDFRDSWKDHFNDTITAGNGICNPKAVEILCKEGPKCLLDLIEKGLNFDEKSILKNVRKDGSQNKNKSKINLKDNLLQKDSLKELENLQQKEVLKKLELLKKLHFTKEAAHSRARILHIGGDQTGLRLHEFLINKIKQKNNIQFLENSLVYQITDFEKSKSSSKLSSNTNLKNIEINFLQTTNDTESQILGKVQASFVILATGGAGQVFLHTTNPEVCTGDGLSLGLDLGLEFADLEFYQFHPTALRLENKVKTNPSQDFLISEAVRGEGGILKNSLGQVFMQKYHTDLELAPRDVVARSIWQEMLETNSKFVFLDIQKIGEEKFKIRFPSIYKKCLQEKINFKKGIPISPSSHYQMGGIKTDLDGQTSKSRIFAIGEIASTGVHGANRLASNSLLEGLVFAKRAALKINLELTQNLLKNNLDQNNKLSKNLQSNYNSDNFLNNPKDLSSQTLSKQEKKLIENLKLQIKTLMWQKVSIVRTQNGLKSTLKNLEKIKIDNLDLLNKISKETIQTKSILNSSLLITQAALARKKSLGSHFIVDKVFENEVL